MEDLTEGDNRDLIDGDDSEDAELEGEVEFESDDEDSTNLHGCK